MYPLSLVKANVGRLCEKLKIGIRSGLKQRCGGNFLAIVAGTILSEKLNFTGGFFEWQRPFDFSTDRLSFVKLKSHLGYTAHIPCCLS